MYQPRRRKKRHTHGLRTVEVMRGRNGYGFTISGQHPSILSCIVAGSPADRAGLKTGDILISLNNLNVSKSSHDDIVRMVGSSSGLLVLQIAENYNSSDSSDDEFQNRPKSKYPNRARRREGHKDRSMDDMHVQSRSGGNKYSSHKKELYDQLRARALSPGRQLEQKYLKQGHSHGNENINPRVGMAGALPKKAKHVSSNDGIIRYRSPNTKHTIITREARLGIQKPHSAPKRGFAAPTEPPPKVPLTAVDNRLSGGYYPYLHPQIAHRHHTPNIPSGYPAIDDDFEENMYIGDDMRIVVGYAGSIEMPHDTKLANSRLQSIRGAVRRLRVEQKIHTLVLMEVTGDGVKLVNTMNCTIAQYPSRSVAFCGVCSDDPRFFGVITLHTAAGTGDQAAVVVGLSGSSCHVFMVDPELSPHSQHVAKARNFGFHCSIHPDTQRCLEFPRSATPIVQCIARLYRERQGVLGEAELAQIGAFAGPNFGRQQLRRESQSSNSDSGLGIPVRDENTPTVGGGNDRVCIVELPRDEDDDQEKDSSMDNSVYVTPSSSLASSMYSSRDVSSILLSTGERIVPGSGDPSRLSSTMDTTGSSLNQSAGPVSNERLNIRAMPNPRGYNMSGSFGDLLEQQNSADNLRKSMHKILKSRQKGPDPSGSDAESVRSESSQGNPQFVLPVVPVSQKQPPLPPRNSLIVRSNPTLAENMAGRQLEPEVLPKRPKSPVLNGIDVVHSELLGKAAETPMQPPRNRERMPTPGQAHDAPKHQDLSTPVIKQVTAQTPGGTRLSGFGAMPKAYHPFSRNTGSTTKPPLPDRKLLGSRAGPRTPVPTPHVERPKSTPPFRNIGDTPGAQKDDYDSDPGELSSYAESLMDVDEFAQPMYGPPLSVTKHSLFSRRRQSDGNGFTKQPEPKSSTKISASRLFSLGRKGKASTISTSHESLVVSDADFPKNKLNGATSVAAIAAPSQLNQNGTTASIVGRVAGWAVNFNKLLEDKDGLSTFTEFLKKEYSEENIIFWSLCEKYKKLKTDSMRIKKAQDIYNAHLSSNASDPVNVDSESRKAAEEGLKNPSLDLFNAPQQHIFKLMKQDSYVRFLKSDLYKECVVREMEGRALPHTDAGDDEEWEDDNGNIDKTLKKSTSTSSTADTTDPKRRKSLLPWNRTKSDKKLVKQNSESDVKRSLTDEGLAQSVATENNRQKGKDTNGNAGIEVQQSSNRPPQAPAKPEVGTQEGVLKENQKFCRVILPDRSTTVIYIQSGQTIKSAIQKLCERRSINLALVEVIEVGSNKALDLSSDISLVGSKEVVLEKKVVFRLDLPNRKTLAMKAKPTDKMRELLKPVLNKYGIKLDENLVVHVAGTGVILGDNTECKALDTKQVVIQSLDDFKGKKKREWGSFGGSHRNLGSKPPIPRGRGDPSPVRHRPTSDLDDVMKSLFKDVSSGITLSDFDEFGVYDIEKREKRGDENRNSGLFGFIRRNSIGEKDGKKGKNKGPGVFSSQRLQLDVKKTTESKKPPLPRAANNLDKDGEKFLDLLTRTSRQIDDQRGGTLKDLELPDFLKVSKPQGDAPEITPRPRLRKNIISDSNLMKKLANGPMISKTLPVSRSHERLNVPMKADLDKSAISIQSLGTPMQQSFHFQDVSFSHDGVVPTHDAAESYFLAANTQSAVDFYDSRLMDKSLQDLGIGGGSAMKNNISFGTFKGQPFQTDTPKKGPASEPRPVPKPRQSRPAVPRRRNPPPDFAERTRESSGARSSSSDLDITLLPPSSDSSEAELPSPSHQGSSRPQPPTPSQRKSKGAPLSTNRPSSLNMQSSHQYSHSAGHNSLPHSSTAQPIVAESDIEYELTETLANQRLHGQGDISESSTPSPTTHDLVLDSESGMESDSNPVPSVRASLPRHVAPSSLDEERTPRKTLIIDPSEATGDMKVSFV